MEIKNQKSKIKNLTGLLVPTLLFVVAVWFDLTPWLRGPDEWRWTLRPITSPERLIVPLVVLALYLIVCVRWLGRSQKVPSTRLLIFVTLAAPIIQLALAFAVSRQPLLQFFGPTVSVHNSGYFTTAVATPDLAALLIHFPAMMPALPIHAQSHPPGPIVMQWAGWQFFQAWPALADSIAMPLRTLQCHNPGLMALDNPQIASASIGMLLPLIGALAVWPMYAFGKRVVGAKAALLAAALFPVLPLFAMWPAQWDQIYPLLLFVGLYFAHTGLESRSPWRLFLAGVPLSIATLFSVGNSVLMAIVGLYGVVWIALNREDGKKTFNDLVSSWLKWISAFALGCASIWIAYALIYHVNPLDVLSTGSQLAWESTTSGRSYGLWLIWNPIDFATFLGVPIVLLLLLNLRKIPKLSRNAWPLMIATFVTLILLDLSGIVRGEVGRLWIYFGPLVMLVAVAGSEEQVDKSVHAVRNTQYALLVGFLALQLLVMNTRWLVNDSFLDEPPVRSPNFVVPNPSIASRASFDHQIALRGYDVSYLPGTANLTLYWQALAQPPHAYTVFVHVLDSNGQQVGQQDNMPVNDQSITSCWQPGEFVADPYSIALQAGALGPFTLEVGLYRVDTAERLRLDDGSGTSLRLKGP